MQHSANFNGGTPTATYVIIVQAAAPATLDRHPRRGHDRHRGRRRAHARRSTRARRCDSTTSGSSNAQWWQDGFTDGADPEYEEQILPLAAECLAGAQRVLDIGTR